jgi:hypothetical protein
MKVIPSTVKMEAEYFSETSVSTHERKHGQNQSEWLIYILVTLLLPVQTKWSMEEDADYEHSHTVIRTKAEVNKELRAVLLECF